MPPRSLIEIPQSIVSERDPKNIRSQILSLMQVLENLDYELRGIDTVSRRQLNEISKYSTNDSILKDADIQHLKGELSVLKQQERDILNQQRNARNTIQNFDSELKSVRDKANKSISQVKNINIDQLFNDYKEFDQQQLASQINDLKEQENSIILLLDKSSQNQEQFLLQQIDEHNKLNSQKIKIELDIDKIKTDIRKQETWLSSLQHQIKILKRK